MNFLWKRLFPYLKVRILNYSHTPPSFYKSYFLTVKMLEWFHISAYGANCCCLILAAFFYLFFFNSKISMEATHDYFEV